MKGERSCRPGTVAGPCVPDILVTGAGGFIGGAIAAHLARQPGIVVHGGTRDGRALGAGIHPARCDVTDAASLGRLVTGFDAIVHCAVGNQAVTVGGTQAVLAAAQSAGVRRVVHLSSVALYGQAEGALDEAHPIVAETIGGYAGWKSAAEAQCRHFAANGLDVAMLRPAIVYGPGSELWVGLPARRLLSGHWGTMGEAGDGICNLVHVDDVATAVLAALQAQGIAGEAFNVAGPEAITWNDWHRRLGLAIGLKRVPEISPATLRRRAIASLPAKALARLLPPAGRMLRPRLLTAPARSELALFRLRATYPTDKAQRLLGWAPRIDIATGLAGSVAWLHHAGVLA